MIIKGYKGVMDLDLTFVDPFFHKIMIEQHKKDIVNYKSEQLKLRPEQRYENSIGKALDSIKYHNKLMSRRFYKIDNYEEIVKSRKSN